MPYFPLMCSKLLFTIFPIPLFMSLFLLSKNTSIIIQWNIMKFNSITMSFPLIIDPVGSMFSATVLFISANVLMFSSEYMKSDIFMQRFCHLVLLFILSMNLLIYIPNTMWLLLGWDGLGITSFILVIYYQNPKSLAAGMITALMNRIGDVMIIMSIVMFMNMGHWSYLSMWPNNYSTYIMLFITLAAMSKSAQIPFSSWLPAAMAAPTPVSALVHSSTLVTAGVFLLIRFYPFLSSLHLFSSFILIISTITMLMAGMAAMFECDMKKIIALSTLSQLGVMMMSLGLGLPMLAMFHLITHAMFKALLFLCAGALIHFHYHSQDLRFFGNIYKSNPLLLTCMFIANMALCGSPFLAGFYSKDMILENSSFDQNNIIIMMMILLATSFTTMYSVRFIIATSWNNSASNPFCYLSDQLSNMTYPMLMLTMGAITVGAIMSWTLFPDKNEPFLPLMLKTWPITIMFLSYMTMWIMYLSKSINQPPMSMHWFNSHMWFLNPTMSQGMILLPLYNAHFNLKIIDQGWMEMSSGQMMYTNIKNMSNKLMYIQNTSITTQLSMLFIFMLMLLSM